MDVSCQVVQRRPCCAQHRHGAHACYVQRFLEENDLKLVMRSHEGPDARFLITTPEGNMKQGWCLDHDTPAGRLYTVFSAPDYPQFQARCSCPGPEELRLHELISMLALRWLPHLAPAPEGSTGVAADGSSTC